MQIKAKFFFFYLKQTANIIKNFLAQKT